VTVGLAADAPLRYDQVDLTVPVAFVFGAEGAGLRRLVRERCDLLVAIPMQGHVGSLNVSVAAGWPSSRRSASGIKGTVRRRIRQSRFAGWHRLCYTAMFVRLA